MSNTPSFTLLYFSFLQEKAGVSEQKRAISDNLNGTLLWQQICEELAIDSNIFKVRFSINHKFANFEDRIYENDIVAFIPPVAGG